jgi:hypothetical protein
MTVSKPPPLRKCPTCLTPVEPMQLGYRDFRFLGDALPGKVAPMDFDFVLERNGHMLVVELKPKGVGIGMGQTITYKTFVKMSPKNEVWLLQGEPTDDQLGFARMSTAGRWVERRSITEKEFVRMVKQWFQKAG